MIEFDDEMVTAQADTQADQETIAEVEMARAGMLGELARVSQEFIDAVMRVAAADPKFDRDVAGAAGEAILAAADLRRMLAGRPPVTGR